MSTKESDVETVCSGVRYSNAHRTGKGILLTAVGSGEVHILSEGSTEPELVARTQLARYAQIFTFVMSCHWMYVLCC